MFRYSKVITGDALYNQLIWTEKLVRYLERLLNRPANTWESMGEKSCNRITGKVLFNDPLCNERNGQR